jgi:acetate kinase
MGMPERPVTLVLNAGSSSLKFAVFEAGARGAAQVYRGEVEGILRAPRFSVRDAAGRPPAEAHSPEMAETQRDHGDLLATVLGWLDRNARELAITAAGHRVVHGGARFSAPVVIDPQVLEALDALAPLAPLHQPHNLSAIRELARRRPGLPQVACFDTAFHRTQPAVAQAFALPRELTDAGIVRYGFHGLSYEHIARALPELAGDTRHRRAVVAHLGSGASMCALEGGRSIATTMSFTALDGLPMGTRAGSMDPGVILYLLSERGMDAAALTDLLYHRSGLLGISGLSSDMRELLAADTARARFAVDVFVYRVQRELGSLAAALGGLDALVFTAGIGERSAPIRARVCEGSAWLGIRLDPEANARGGPRISAADSPVSVWVIPTDEERMIAEHTHALVGARTTMARNAL